MPEVHSVSAAGDASPGSRPPSDILVVDDDARNMLGIEAALGDFGRRLVKAASGREALRRLLEQDFALILLDVRMPDLDGFETAKLIRLRERNRHVPIIFITAFSPAETEILRGYRLGAVDFLFKPIVPEVLRAKAAVFVELQERTEEVRRQTRLLHELERQEEERRLAAERQRWEADLLREESRRKDEFLAILAHELRNPLAPVVSGLELLRLRGLVGDEQRRVRDVMERQVRHLVRLVDDLLDVARISQGKIELRKERVAVDQVVEQAVESTGPAVAAAGHRLELERPEASVWVEADPVRLHQILANLLTNAVRYTDPGGEISVRWGAAGGEARIEVADNGRGIEVGMLERIFDWCVQGQGDGQGLGLGLTLVRQLVAAHGGRVAARSAGPGSGATFEVVLPLAAAAVPAGGPLAETAAVPDCGAARRGEGGEVPVRVLVVDDHADVREGMRTLLQHWGHEVEVAADGPRGIERALAMQPQIMLVDIRMPGMDGYEVAAAVRAELGAGAPRMVALSGFGRARDRERAGQAGFDEHLTKPAPPEELRRILRSIARGEPIQAQAAPAEEGRRQGPAAETGPNNGQDGAG